MSEPIKGLPSDEVLSLWAQMLGKGDHWAKVATLATEILRLRSELAKASAEVQRLESLRGAESALSQVSASDIEAGERAVREGRWVTMDDIRREIQSPPADVLGEAFHVAMEEAARATSEYQRFGNLKLAIYELAQVVERLAVNQQGLKSLDEKISETIYCADPSKICPWLDRNNGESVENYVRRKTWESLVLLARRMGIEVRK